MMKLEELEKYDFVLNIDYGAVAPIESSLKNLYLEIFNNTTKICNIKGINYDITSDKMIKIKDYIKSNINLIVGYAMQEDSEYFEYNNKNFGGCLSIFIKVGLLTVSLNGVSEDTIKEFLVTFIENVMMIIKGEK